MSDMLKKIEWANRRIEKLGLEETCCVVYTFGAARLLSASGLERDSVVGEPEFAIWLIVTRLEHGLKRLLTGSS